MKVKTLVCNCRGIDSFRRADMNSLGFEIEAETDVAYAAIHPQLCAENGARILEDVLRSAEDDPDTYVIVCACAEEAQSQLFKKTLEKMQFAADHFVPVDVTNTTNAGILARIRERLNELASPQKLRH